MAFKYLLGVNVNVVVLSYIKTNGGEELLTRTKIISEEIEQERTRKQKKFEIDMNDTPGTYDAGTLRDRLHSFLAREKVTNRRMREIFRPALLSAKCVSRTELKRKFVDLDSNDDDSKVGNYLSVISSQLGMAKNDFLRQVVACEYPRHHWEKDNFSVREEYRDLVKGVLESLKA